MDVRLLGPVEVRLEGRPVELGPRKQRAVFAMLALEVGRTVPVDRLAEGLWGDEPPASAPKMIQLYVSHLRRLLDGSGAGIVTHGRGYELELTGCDVDVRRFEHLVDDLRAREALDLWRGDPLGDVADAPFAASEIRRLDELRLRAVECAIDADLAAGRHAEVLAEIEALVVEQPLREHLHAQHMLALYRSGRQSDALAAYRRARADLVELIGVEPGAELRGLQDAILAQDPALDAPAPADTQPSASPRPPPRRSGRGLLIAAAALVLAGITAFGVSRVLEPDTLPGIDANSVGVIDAGKGRITAQYTVGKSPSAVLDGGGSVWIANAADGTVSRIRRGHDPAVAIPVDGRPAALAFGGGSLWVADSDSRDVVQVDPGANKVVQRIAVGNAPRALAAVAGAVWVASGVDGRLVPIDLERGRVMRSIAMDANPSSLAAGAGSLWVASEEAGTVTRVEPRTHGVLPPIRVGDGPSALAVGEGAVWVVNRYEGTLSRIDPEANAVSWKVPVGRDPTAVATGGGAVWVAGGEDGTVVRVDPDDPRDVRRFKTGSSPAAIAVARGSVWAAADAPQAAHRGGTLRALIPVVSHSRVPIDSLHPDAYTSVHTFQLSSLAYDGLVTYRRVEGAAGATIVGALAASVPAPTAAGRAYVFTLRRGVRFSDGRLVRPEDFRASMERYLRVTGTNLPEYFSAIVGAHECVRHPARCDLSGGILTDGVAGTITIRLRHPDGELLHKLTLPFASVVPAHSPMRATTGRTPPGTGPYRVVAWDARRGGEFARNPYFRPVPARPDGYADRIDVRLRNDKTIEAQITAVQRGAADVAIVVNPFQSEVSPERLRALVARAPGRIHSRPVPTSDWMFMNVRERPFDDPRVRKAVNLAIDRERVVDIKGGTQVGRPTCQIIPIAFPGYEPYCPYGADAAAGGGASAPDVARARQLVTRSGRAGERVVLYASEFEVPVGRYFAGLLDDLGLPTRLRVLRYDDARLYDPRSRAQAGLAGWGADYLSPSTFVQAGFECSARFGKDPQNLSRLCDRTLERQIRRAAALAPAKAGRAWAAADRRVVDLAATVPMTNRRGVVLVSERAGNVKSHAMFFTLLDQMWVR